MIFYLTQNAVFKISLVSLQRDQDFGISLSVLWAQELVLRNINNLEIYNKVLLSLVMLLCIPWIYSSYG